MKIKVAVVLGFLATLVAPVASAHTIAIGTVNAGIPGSVTLWMGTYSHGAGFVQGSITLNGVTQAFGNLALTLPAGLVEGDNYFYASNDGVVGKYTSPVNTTGLTAANWQSATFTGLAAGVYAYAISGMTSVNWADWNSGQANWTGFLTIPESSVVGVPEPASLALLGLGLLGLGFTRRRRAA